tara:strand:- start:1177 stop:1806 length:630 start_codon:yes stop_codon:yes gene_type:complete
MYFYAVKNGFNPGIYKNWEDCEKQVKYFPNACYKKFKTLIEAKDYIYNIRASPIEREGNCLYIYTDGSCSNNGRENAKAGIGVYFGENDLRNLSERVIARPQTNNVAELLAIIKAYEIIRNDFVKWVKVIIFTDSEYAIKCANKYGEKCAKSNWAISIPNKDLVKKVYEIFKLHSDNLSLEYIRAHTNKTDIHSFGNNAADKLAKKAVS